MADMAGYCDVCKKSFQNMAMHNKTQKHIKKANLGVDKVVNQVEASIEKTKNPVSEIVGKIIPSEPKTEPIIQEVEPQIEDKVFIQPKESGLGTILTILILPFMALVGFLYFIMMRKGGDNYE